MEDSKNQEEVVRDVRDYLNKNTRPEDCWALNISWAISRYLQLLDDVDEDSEGLGSENIDLFNEGGGHQMKRQAGINFCLAGSLLFDATRAFAKKVDYLGATLNSTLSNLTSGTLQGTKSKKDRSKKASRNIRGVSALPGWLIPEVPESLEMMHLPWEHLSCKDAQDLLLPEEAHFHAKATEVIAGYRDDSMESFADNLLKSANKITYPDIPLCVDCRSIANQRKICLTRPAICLMPRVQKQNTAKNDEEIKTDGEIKRSKKMTYDIDSIASLLQSYKLTDSPMDVSGALYLPFLRKGTSTVPSSLPVIRLDGTCRLDSSEVLPGSIIPGTCATSAAMLTHGMLGSQPDQRTSIFRGSIGGFGGGIDQAGVDSRQSTMGAQPPMKVTPLAEVASGVKKPSPHSLRLVEHEVLGKDCPLRVGKPCSKPANIDLYNLKLADIDCPEVIELLVNGPRHYINSTGEKKLQIAWKISEWKIERKLKVRPRRQRPFDIIMKDKGLTAFEKAEKLRLNLNCHPLFEEVKIGANPLDVYCLNDPCFSAISARLMSKLQKPRKVVTFKGGRNAGNEGGEMQDDPSAYLEDEEERHTPDFTAMDDDMEGGASWNDNSCQGALAQAASTIGRRMSLLSQAQTPLLKDTKTEQKSSLFELHQRVWRWRNRVEKWIAFTTNLGPFLVPAYVEKIADHLASKKENREQSGQEVALPTEKETKINFREMVKDRRKHEVCRLFLTTLILANHHSFTISNTTDDDGKCNLIIEVGSVSPESLTKDYFEVAHRDHPPSMGTTAPTPSPLTTTSTIEPDQGDLVDDSYGTARRATRPQKRPNKGKRPADDHSPSANDDNDEENGGDSQSVTARRRVTPPGGGKKICRR